MPKPVFVIPVGQEVRLGVNAPALFQGGALALEFSGNVLMEGMPTKVLQPNVLFPALSVPFKVTTAGVLIAKFTITNAIGNGPLRSTECFTGLLVDADLPPPPALPTPTPTPTPPFSPPPGDDGDHCGDVDVTAEVIPSMDPKTGEGYTLLNQKGKLPPKGDDVVFKLIAKFGWFPVYSPPGPTQTHVLVYNGTEDDVQVKIRGTEIHSASDLATGNKYRFRLSETVESRGKYTSPLIQGATWASFDFTVTVCGVAKKKVAVCFHLPAKGDSTLCKTLF